MGRMDKVNHRALVVCADFPFPANHGGRLDVIGRLRSLKRVGYDVDVLVCGDSPADEYLEHLKAEGLNGLLSVPRVRGLKTFLLGLFRMLPYQVSSRARLSSWVCSVNYDLIVLEGDYVGQILEAPSYPKDAVTVLRVHNNEARYAVELAKASKGLFQKIFYYTEAFLFGVYSAKLYRRVHRLWMISKSELKGLGDALVGKAVWIPTSLSIPFAGYQKSHHAEMYALFVGNLFMPNNLEGLRWLLHDVWPLVLKQIGGAKLKIAGNAKNGLPDFLAENSLPAGISVFTNVSDSERDALYSSARLCVNPCLSGAGVKVKSVEVLAHGIPLVSTSKGIEGMGIDVGLHALVGDAAVDFANAIVDVLRSDDTHAKLALNGRQYYLQSFGSDCLLELELNAFS